MIYVKHHTTAPRKLVHRFSQGIPSCPTSAWSSFKGKAELKDNLFAIQNGLCAYCEIRIDSEIGSHLEHIESKSQNPSKTFEYTNIVSSCIKGSLVDSEDTNPMSCGHAKKRQSIDIKPTDINCEDYFSFDLFGKIIPNTNRSELEQKKAQNTIDTLNLNCLRLKRDRKSVV